MTLSNENPVIKALEAALADTYILYFKTHAFHWNVTGPHFKGLHDLFAQQYTDMWMAIDVIAERIRILGALAPSHYAALTDSSTIKECKNVPNAQGMVKELATDNRALVTTLYKALKAAQDSGDEGTIALMAARIEIHEKAAWMLEASAA